MSLIDIVDQTIKHQVIKTEAGEQRIFGVLAGIVTENYHKDMPGCVCVQIPVRDQEVNILKWVKVISPYGGAEWGQFFLPEKGDQVLLAFEGGSIDKPYVIGSLPLERAKFLSKSVDESNQKKRLVTRHGNEIAFFDSKEGEGEKDVLEIHTAGRAHEVILDNAKKKIILQDQEKNCQIELQTEKGNLKIYAVGKLSLQVGDSIKVEMNGSSGAVNIEANKLTVNAGRKLECKTDGTAKISGQQTIVEAGSALKLESSGIASIAGSPIKLG